MHGSVACRWHAFKWQTFLHLFLTVHVVILYLVLPFWSSLLVQGYWSLGGGHKELIIYSEDMKILHTSQKCVTCFRGATSIPPQNMQVDWWKNVFLYELKISKQWSGWSRLSLNYQLTVVLRKFDILKTNICPQTFACTNIYASCGRMLEDFYINLTEKQYMFYISLGEPRDREWLKNVGCEFWVSHFKDTSVKRDLTALIIQCKKKNRLMFCTCDIMED